MASVALSNSNGRIAVERRTFQRGVYSPVFPELSITKSARKLGIGRSTLSLLINGARKAGPSHVPVLAKFLGISESEVVRLYGSDRLKKARNIK